jgi:hypothetical protein
MTRTRVTVALFVVALLCIVGGLALLSPPVGLVAAGVTLLALLTFDPAKARRLTWPR